MSDYISREAAIERIKDEWAKLPLSETTGFAILMRVLTKAPAADVRPVVLCRDCQHWDTDWIPNHARENEHFCPYIGLTTIEDWFCADGEKREGE